MKNYLPLLCVAVLIGGCGKYPSRDEAKQACNDWWEKGEVIRYSYDHEATEYISNYGYYGNEIAPTIKTYLKKYDGVHYSRDCTWEKETRQYMGKEGEFTNEDRLGNGKHFPLGEKGRPSAATNIQIVKRFRY